MTTNRSETACSRPPRRAPTGTRSVLTTLVTAALFVAVGPWLAAAHDADLAIAGKKLSVRTDDVPDKRRMKFVTSHQLPIGVQHSPLQSPSWILLRGFGQNGGTTGRIDLDPARWTTLGSSSSPSGYKYVDSSGTQSGITSILLKPGKLTVKAAGPNWTWQPGGLLSSVWLYFGIDDEAYCANFGGYIRRNEAGRFEAKNAVSPGVCRPSICSNGEVELTEECDDGNLVEDDGCTSDCVTGVCVGQSFDSTFEAIQELVFATNGCTDLLCHGSAPGQGALDLSPAVAYDSMLDVPSSGSVYDRIEPGAPSSSSLYLKLLKAVDPSTDIPGVAMPVGLPPIHEDLLEAVRRWILSGAPETGTVAGTEALLGGCFPPPGPISIAPLEPPDPAEGFQLEMPAAPLPAESESEVCFATYYDVTNAVPVLYKDPTNTYFYSTQDVARMDPHSHHLVIMHSAVPESEVNHPAFGAWTCIGGPQAGQSCNPLNANSCGAGICRSQIGNNLACIGYGPPGGPTAANPASALGGSGNGQVSSALPPGLYRKVPLKGFVYWNLHAFNLTSQDHAMKAYLNLMYSEQQQYEVQAFTDFHAIYAAAGLAPYTRGTYCATHTFPQGTRLFLLSSHTHQRGEVFWIDDPQGNEIYRSFYYNDPAVGEYDPPLALDSANAADRTFTYCATYNNGVAPDDSPDPATVRKLSTTPPNGTFCNPVACTEGLVGAPCNGSLNHAACDSFPGAGDGFCDACAITAGVSTEDEMFVLTGRSYLVPVP